MTTPTPATSAGAPTPAKTTIKKSGNAHKSAAESTQPGRPSSSAANALAEAPAKGPAKTPRKRVPAKTAGAATTTRPPRPPRGRAVDAQVPMSAVPASTGLAALRTVSKVSVSLPDALTRSVRDRVGRGRFSAYVTAAVERQLELDRLAELVDGFEERLGRPISDELMAEAEAAWHAE